MKDEKLMLYKACELDTVLLETEMKVYDARECYPDLARYRECANFEESECMRMCKDEVQKLKVDKRLARGSK
jgi:hypothetical protein